MELPNPDPKEGRPKHGGRDRHACVSVKDVTKIKEVFDKAGMFKSGLNVSVATAFMSLTKPFLESQRTSCRFTHLVEIRPPCQNSKQSFLHFELYLQVAS